MWAIPPLLPRYNIHTRLEAIFPAGTPHRNYCTRELAASTVFTALYVGAIEGTEVWFGPKHVYRMTDRQAGRSDDASRKAYASKILRAGFQPSGRRWYSDNTREPIRDETLREGFVALGAVIEKAGVPTTSSKPRYALSASFAALFDPALTGKSFDVAVSTWQTTSLNPGALARIALVRQGAAIGGSHVLVTYPNGETRRMVEIEKNLPDAILVDLGPKHPLLVFVQAVATDGPVNERRKAALEELATTAGFSLQHVAFVTAYLDRSEAAFKKTVDTLAWGSYAWFASEPDGLVELSKQKQSLK
jgi:hypothetical protein